MRLLTKEWIVFSVVSRLPPALPPLIVIYE